MALYFVSNNFVIFPILAGADPGGGARAPPDHQKWGPSTKILQNWGPRMAVLGRSRSGPPPWSNPGSAPD